MKHNQAISMILKDDQWGELGVRFLKKSFLRKQESRNVDLGSGFPFPAFTRKSFTGMAP